MKILVVEDHKFIRATITRYLVSQGHELVTLEQAQGHYQEAINFAPDMVLCDWEFPGGTALDFLRLMTTSLPQTRYTIMSGSHKGGIQSQLHRFELDQCNFLQKPFNLTELKIHIAQSLSLQKTGAGAQLITS